jgi:2-aminoadipate transaminase
MEMLSEDSDRYNGEGLVVFLGTLSKIMAPGLRIGWIEAPARVTVALGLLKQSTDLHTSSLNQLIAAEFLANHATNYWERIRIAYRGKRDQIIRSLDTHLSKYIAQRTTPDGGLFVWLQLKDGVDSMKLLSTAIDSYNVAYVPGAPFFATRPAGDFIRLSFATVPVGQMDEGIGLLAEAISRFKA